VLICEGKNILNLETLYEDETYNDYLVTLSRKNLIPYDDFRQEVFANLIELPKQDIHLLAKKIAMRMMRADIKQRADSLDVLGYSFNPDDSLSVLWEARHVLV
jgi:hypothetical protein